MQQNDIQQEIEKKAKNLCYQGDERVAPKPVTLNVNSSEDIIVKNVRVFSNHKEYNQDQRAIFFNVRKLPQFEQLTKENVFGNKDFVVTTKPDGTSAINGICPGVEAAVKMGNIIIKYSANQHPFKLKLEYINREKMQLQKFFTQDYQVKFGEEFQIIQFEDLIPMHLDDFDRFIGRPYHYESLLDITYLGLRKVCNVVRNGVIKMAFGEPVDLIYLQEYLGYSVFAGHGEAYSIFVLNLLNCIEKPNQNKIINFLQKKHDLNVIVNFVNSGDAFSRCLLNNPIVKKNGKDCYLYNDFAVILSIMGIPGIDKNKIDQVNCSYTHDQRLALAKIIYKINGLDLATQRNNKQIKDTQQITQKNTINSEGFDKITQVMDDLMGFDSKVK